MSSELAPVTADTVLVLPHTGELINLQDAPTVAQHLRELRELDDKIREAKGILTEALAAEAQRRGTKTLHLEGFGTVELTGGPESYLQWDFDVLALLRDEGLPEERWNQLVKVEVTYRVDARVAHQLEAANPRYAEILAVARKRADRPWRAAVK